MKPEKYTNVQGGLVTLRRFVQIGSSTVIMPDLTIEEGSAIGAMSFVKKSIPKFQIWGGNPLRFIKHRKIEMLGLAYKLEHEL